MKKSNSCNDELMEALRNSEEVAEYLKAASADPNQEVFLLASRDVIAAMGGTAKNAEFEGPQPSIDAALH
ncbi:MAG: hypothetical protein JXL20_12925 [Deltaproteobacteria bacterium]|nr:hypothetical protein [Deltaproteobacteria bacterium]